MRDRLPPLFSLQAFEAAARLENFSRAAIELKLTPGAVSRQIRQLEDWCALTLFERNGPQIQLTPEGHELLARLGGPLSALHRAVYPQSDTLQTLQIATLASTAKAWLLPRLPDFQKKHPDIALIIHTDYALTRPPPRVAMVALRQGGRANSELHSELLFEDTLVAVTSPAFSKCLSQDATRWPAHALLQHASLNPQRWLEIAGLPTGFNPTGMAFNDADVLLDAAQAGMGIALTRLSLAWPRLRTRSLVLASEVTCPFESPALLVYRKDCAALPTVAAFTHWVRAEAVVWAKVLAGFDAKSPEFKA